MMDMRNIRSKVEAALNIDPKTDEAADRRANLLHEAAVLASVAQADQLYRIGNFLEAISKNLAKAPKPDGIRMYKDEQESIDRSEAAEQEALYGPNFD